jgi:CRP/FNR family transcriptional regulator, cyclic AMP receptor protein
MLDTRAATSPRGETLAALDRSWFGAALAPETQVRLAALARIVRIPVNGVVLAEGEPCATFAIVLAGRIALRMLVPERGNVTILTVEAGDVVGWSALVPPYRSTSTAVCVESAALLSFDAEPLRERLRADHALAASLYPRVLQAASRRLVATRLQLLDLFAHDARAPREPIPW